MLVVSQTVFFFFFKLLITNTSNSPILQVGAPPAIYSGEVKIRTDIVKSEIKRKCTFFFFWWNFHTLYGEQIAIFYQLFKSGSSKKLFKCPQFTKVLRVPLKTNSVSHNLSLQMPLFIYPKSTILTGWWPQYHIIHHNKHMQCYNWSKDSS